MAEARREGVDRPDEGSGCAPRLAVQNPSIALLIQEMGRSPRLAPALDPGETPLEFREGVPEPERDAFLARMSAAAPDEDSLREAPSVDDGTHRERLLVLGELCRIGDPATRQRAGRELLAMRSDRITMASRPRTELADFCDRVRESQHPSALVRSVAAAVERSIQDGGEP